MNLNWRNITIVSEDHDSSHFNARLSFIQYTGVFDIFDCKLEIISVFVLAMSLKFFEERLYLIFKFVLFNACIRHYLKFVNSVYLENVKVQEIFAPDATDKAEIYF